MRTSLSVRSVVAPSDVHVWSQVLTLPHAYGLLEVEDAVTNPRSRGIHILEELTRTLDRPILTASQLEALADRVSTKGIRTLFLLVPHGAEMVIVLRGMGACYLTRDKQVACLLHRSGSISGEVHPGDTVLLFSETVSKIAGIQVLLEQCGHENIEELADQLTSQLFGSSVHSGGTALLIQVPEPSRDGSDVPMRSDEDTRQASYRMFSGARLRLTRLMGAMKRSIRKLRITKRVVALILAVLLFALFSISVYLGVKRQYEDRQTQVFQSVTVEGQRLLEEGAALIELNPTKGRQRLREAKELVSPHIGNLTGKTKEERRLSDLAQAIDDNLTTAMQIQHVTPELFFDASLVKTDARISSLALAGDVVGFIDSIGRTVYALSVSSKSSQVTGGGNAYVGASLVAVHGDRLFVLADNGIHVSGGSQTPKLGVIKPSDEWGRITSMVAYGGNIYLLDVEKSRIWKYQATDAGFSDLREYLNPDTLPDLSMGTGMAIDGSVWVGTSQGQIVRFTQGRENTFVPRGVDPPLSTRLYVYTSDEVAHIYVLEYDAHRIVQLAKDGEYIASYNWQHLSPDAFVVTEERKKILLLADGKIYSISLK